MSGEGARITGGRFNRIGKPALYLALRFETAVGECAQGFAHRIPPMTLCEYEVDCEPVADLRDEQGRERLNVTMTALACPWKALMLDGKPVPSQGVAERLEREGFAGMLVPSFFHGASASDANLVLWRWGDRLPTLVTVHDPDRRLPRDQRSWEN